MMKRGCAVTFVHFHSYPILSRASQEKARELVAAADDAGSSARGSTWCRSARFSSRSLLDRARPDARVVYRRLMLRIAERIARKRRAQALVTGDVVGQVASQTLENLAVIGQVATLPVFRPLIGMDKDEITTEASRIGTYPDLDHSGPGLLHAVHAAQPADQGAPRTRSRRQKWRCRSPSWWNRRSPRPSWKTSNFRW